MKLTEHELWVEIRCAMQGETTFAGWPTESVMQFGFCNLARCYLKAGAISEDTRAKACRRAMAIVPGNLAHIEKIGRYIKRKKALAQFIKETTPR